MGVRKKTRILVTWFWGKIEKWGVLETFSEDP